MDGNLGSQIKSAEEASRKALFRRANLHISGGSKYDKTDAKQDSGMSLSFGFIRGGLSNGPFGLWFDDAGEMEEAAAPILMVFFFWVGGRGRGGGKGEKGGRGFLNLGHVAVEVRECGFFGWWSGWEERWISGGGHLGYFC